MSEEFSDKEKHEIREAVKARIHSLDGAIRRDEYTKHVREKAIDAVRTCEDVQKKLGGGV